MNTFAKVALFGASLGAISVLVYIAAKTLGILGVSGYYVGRDVSYTAYALSGVGLVASVIGWRRLRAENAFWCASSLVAVGLNAVALIAWATVIAAGRIVPQ